MLSKFKRRSNFGEYGTYAAKKFLKQTGSKIAKSNNISRKMYLEIFFSLETVRTRFLSSWIQNQWKSYMRIRIRYILLTSKLPPSCPKMILFLVHNTPIYLLFVDLLTLCVLWYRTLTLWKKCMWRNSRPAGSAVTNGKVFPGHMARLSNQKPADFPCLLHLAASTMLEGEEKI
jgi:hypothetical protein